jgi:predicted transcriptional regulator
MTALRKRPSNKNQLSKELGIDYKGIQHHIKVLEKNNLVIKTGNRYGLTYCVSALFENNEIVFDEIIDKLKNGEINFG